MKFLIETKINGTIFWLSRELAATDVRARAKEWNSEEVRRVCAKQNSDKAWRDFRIEWHYVPSIIR